MSTAQSVQKLNLYNIEESRRFWTKLKGRKLSMEALALHYTITVYIYQPLEELLLRLHP